MSAIILLIQSLLGQLFFTLAPIPPAPPPDPMARGYVGITIGDGLAIDTVMPGMPAEKAGLKSGDIITRVGTLKPENFDEVVLHVCSFRPGAVVEVEVMRGTEAKLFRITLTERPADADLDGRIPNAPIIDDDD